MTKKKLLKLLLIAILIVFSVGFVWCLVYCSNNDFHASPNSPDSSYSSNYGDGYNMDDGEDGLTYGYRYNINDGEYGYGFGNGGFNYYTFS